METTDKQIGKNLTRIRNDEGLTQKEVADRMRSLGWKWAQATVWMVETGERPLRLAEAADLSDIFAVDAWQFTRTEKDFEVTRAAYQAQEALDRLTEAAERFESLRTLMLKAAAKSGIPAEAASVFYEIKNSEFSVTQDGASALRQ